MTSAEIANRTTRETREELGQMDPNAALKTAREAQRILLDESMPDGSSQYDELEQLAAADSLAQAFEALDGWMSDGGFKPEAWSRFDDEPGEGQRS